MGEFKIEKLSMDNFEAVWDFMMSEFVPDEPLMRATDSYAGDGFAEKTLKAEVREKFTRKPLESGDSFGAFDNDGKLLGVRLGFISDKQSLTWEPSLTWMLRLPSFLFSKKFMKILQVSKFVEDIGYSDINGFDQCSDNNGKIYFCKVLGVSRDGRGKGLGSKMLEKSIGYAKEQGCSHMYGMCTGKASQKIFQNHGFYLIKEKDYESYKDKEGNVIIQHDVHTSSQVVALKLNE